MTRDSAITHHPGDDLLSDYHRGVLAPGLALAISAHADTCPHCRASLELFDAVGGALLDDVEGVAMSESALDLALARIERPEEAAPAQGHRPDFLAGVDLPDSLDTARIPGRYWAAPGVWMAPVRLDGARSNDKTYLMSVKRGMVMPEHSHRGHEVTLVLKGRFSAAMGEYRPGDFVLCNQHTCHSPVMADDEDCLCLVWQDATILPKTWLGKLLQPLARI